jgi:hypothetical protein
MELPVHYDLILQMTGIMTDGGGSVNKKRAPPSATTEAASRYNCSVLWFPRAAQHGPIETK